MGFLDRFWIYWLDEGRFRWLRERAVRRFRAHPHLHPWVLDGVSGLEVTRWEAGLRAMESWIGEQEVAEWFLVHAVCDHQPGSPFAVYAVLTHRARVRPYLLDLLAVKAEDRELQLIQGWMDVLDAGPGQRSDTDHWLRILGDSSMPTAVQEHATDWFLKWLPLIGWRPSDPRWARLFEGATTLLNRCRHPDGKVWVPDGLTEKAARLREATRDRAGLPPVLLAAAPV